MSFSSAAFFARSDNSGETVYGACGLKPNPPRQFSFPRNEESASSTISAADSRGRTSINSTNHQVRSGGGGMLASNAGIDSILAIGVVPQRPAPANPRAIDPRQSLSEK